MKSKIIKVSIILIFMMFSAGLFNFCFAWNIGTDIIHKNDLSFSMHNSMQGNIQFADFTVAEPTVKPTIDNIKIESGTSITYPQDFINAYNSNPSFIKIDNKNYPNSIIYCFPLSSDYILFYSSATYSIKFGASDFTYPSSVNGGTLRYDYVEKQWYLGAYPSISSANHYYIIGDISYPVYDNNRNLIYEPVQEPTVEELITNCDFRVNFKFAPKSEDFPTDNIGTRWSWPCRLLLQHFMTNWDNYNVKVKLSVADKTQPNGLYYDLYNSEGEEIKKKGHIKEAFLTEEINNGDFFLMFTDNLQDTFKLEYEIYNNSNELLMTKSYTFKFTKSGLTYYNSTGTIIEEQTKDASGNDISSENNSFDTNGYDNTNNNNDNDYYDVSNLNNLASSASETINLTQKCFAILPGFIWAMVGIFLTVCIALRILGR